MINPRETNLLVVSKESLIDKLFLKTFYFWVKTQDCLIKRYLFFRLKRYSWAYFVRVSNRYLKKRNKFLSFPKGIKLP